MWGYWGLAGRAFSSSKVFRPGASGGRGSSFRTVRLGQPFSCFRHGYEARLILERASANSTPGHMNSGADYYSSRLTSTTAASAEFRRRWSLSLLGGRSSLTSYRSVLVMHSALLLNANRNSCTVCPASAGSRHG